MTIENLMKNSGCEVWPERWKEIYQRAMHKYEVDGAVCAMPPYYDGLEEKYHMFGEYLDTFKRGAEAVSKDEYLIRLLALISDAMTDHDLIYEDLKKFKPPVAPEGKDPFPYNMLIGLASCSMADYTYNKLASRGVPMEMTYKILSYYVAGLTSYRSFHDGEDGFCHFLWQQTIASGRLLPIGRFNIELGVKMTGFAKIFVNKNGDQVALAHNITLHRSGFPLGAKYFEDEEGCFCAEVTETEDSYIGYPYKENGYVSKEKTELKKNEWECKLSHLDKVISIHIPGKQKFTPDIVDESLNEALEFIKKYFPDEMSNAFHCYSWMCDPQLIELLPESSNISNFCRRFKHLANVSQGIDVPRFIFQTVDDNIDYDSLPEDTSLRKIMKEHYKSGKAIYETTGYFFIN